MKTNYVINRVTFEVRCHLSSTNNLEEIEFVFTPTNTRKMTLPTLQKFQSKNNLNEAVNKTKKAEPLQYICT